MIEERFALAATTSQQTVLTITGVTGNTIDFFYRTLPGNRPSSLGNVAYIWQASNQVPWGTPPLNKFPIQTDTQSGSGSFSNLDVTNLDYILGYAVGPDTSTICSTGYVPVIGGGDFQYRQTSLALGTIGPTSLSVNYSTPIGYQPLTNKNWAGIWEGETASYNNPPKWMVAASLDVSAASLSFNNIALRRGWTYTVAWFMGGWNTTAQKLSPMAASLTFTNS